MKEKNTIMAHNLVLPVESSELRTNTTPFAAVIISHKIDRQTVRTHSFFLLLHLSSVYSIFFRHYSHMFSFFFLDFFIFP